MPRPTKDQGAQGRSYEKIESLFGLLSRVTTSSRDGQPQNGKTYLSPHFAAVHLARPLPNREPRLRPRR